VPEQRRRERAVDSALDSFGLALIAMELLRLAWGALTLQWDFRAYLAAAHAARVGLDPYQIANLSAVTGRRVILGFLYPPIALLPFLALAPLPWPTAAALWAGLKLALIVFLTVVWRRVFLPDVRWIAIGLVVVYGFGAAAIVDLRAGNIGLIECALLTLALASYAKGHLHSFAALVVAAAVFKLAPAVFLLLLLVRTRNSLPRPRLFAISLAVLAALVVLPGLVGPARHWQSWNFLNARGFPLGDANPSLLSLSECLIGGPPAVAGLSALAIGAWAVGVAGLLMLGVGLFRRSMHEAGRLEWAMFAVLVYYLAQPRPMAYGLTLAGLAALGLRPPPFASRVGTLLLALLVSAEGMLASAHLPPQGTAAEHQPVLIVALLWLLLVRAGTLLRAT